MNMSCEGVRASRRVLFSLCDDSKPRAPCGQASLELVAFRFGVFCHGIYGMRFGNRVRDNTFFFLAIVFTVFVRSMVRPLVCSDGGPAPEAAGWFGGSHRHRGRVWAAATQASLHHCEARAGGAFWGNNGYATG